MKFCHPLLRALLVAVSAAWAWPAAALEYPLPADGGEIVGEVRIIKARYEDTFALIGEQNDLGYAELVAANPGVDPWLPGEGTEIILPTRFILPPGPREGIVINLPEYRLYYFPKDRPVVYTFPLGIGREGWSSPVANTTIRVKTPNPAWYPPQSIRDEHVANGQEPLPRVVPPGPDNPLGPFKFTLGLPGYLIHGSNKKFGIGMRVSHGCFRMLNNNVLELSKLVDVGTNVRIIEQPYKFGRLGDGRLYLEVHAPLLAEGEHMSLMDKHERIMQALMSDEIAGGYQLDWEVIRDIVAGEDGVPVRIAEPQATAAAIEESHNPF